MDLVKLEPTKQGAFSEVFLDRERRIAYKLYISYYHPKADRYEYNEASFNEFRRKVFNSEYAAYKILNNSDLAKYIPLLYEQPNIERIYDINGADISSYFLMDCCNALELVEGESKKQALIDRDVFSERYNINLDDIFIEMRNLGVNFIVDTDIITQEEGFKIIDFATQDFANFE